MGFDNDGFDQGLSDYNSLRSTELSINYYFD